VVALFGVGPSGPDEKPAKPELRITTDHQRHKDAAAFADILRKDLRAPLRGSALLELFDKEAAGTLVPFEVLDLGELTVHTGKVAGFDGITFSGGAYAKEVPKGKYPVLIAVARFKPGEGKKEGDQRVAFARLRLSDKPAVRWEPALFEGTDPKKRKPGAADEYGVDAGIGAFADKASRKELDRLTKELNDKWDEDWVFGKGKLLSVMDRVYRSTRSWARVKIGRAEMVLFSSGWGDGRYPSYWGYDADGKLAALLTDFKVVDWRGNPHPPERERKEGR
jgi:hypothetical protein